VSTAGPVIKLGKFTLYPSRQALNKNQVRFTYLLVDSKGRRHEEDFIVNKEEYQLDPLIIGRKSVDAITRLVVCAIS